MSQNDFSDGWNFCEIGLIECDEELGPVCVCHKNSLVRMSSMFGLAHLQAAIFCKSGASMRCPRSYLCFVVDLVGMGDEILICYHVNHDSVRPKL